MQIEIFAKTSADVSEDNNAPDCEPFEDYATIEDLKARITICGNLGLKAQKDILSPLYSAYSLKRTIPFPFLTKVQEEWLADVFPTHYAHYRAGINFDDGLRDLANYAFDLLPLPILTVWNQAHERKLFSAYEIWTREARRLSDPVLIGRRCEHNFVYLLSRWGESLRPWEELSHRWGYLVDQLPVGRRA
jgi:hypothetical protein